MPTPHSPLASPSRTRTRPHTTHTGTQSCRLPILLAIFGKSRKKIRLTRLAATTHASIGARRSKQGYFYNRNQCPQVGFLVSPPPSSLPSLPSPHPYSPRRGYAADLRTGFERERLRLSLGETGFPFARTTGFWFERASARENAPLIQTHDLRALLRFLCRTL